MRSIESLADLDSLFDLSHTKPVMLFKHSSRCNLSSTAYNVYSAYLKTADVDAVEYTFLDLLVHRDVSNAIAEKTGIVHQSPQAILIVEGRPVWNASHFNISSDALEQAVSGLI